MHYFSESYLILLHQQQKKNHQTQIVLETWMLTILAVQIELKKFPSDTSYNYRPEKKNKCLTEKNRRLESKVQSLECIINDLHSRSLISDAGANNLKVKFFNLVC